LKRLAILIFLCAASSQAASTYYVSSSAGSDSNTTTQAKSKSTPWAHVPGMANAASNAAAYSAVSGDTFILMGCDVWFNASFPLTLTHGGSTGAGNVVTIGVDKTWFNTSNCPSAWNRPIFDAHTSAGSSTPTQIGGTTSGCPAGGNYFVAFNTSYLTLDNVEMRNLFYHNDAESSCYGTNLMWAVNNADFVTVSNGYQHDWKMNTPYNASTSNDTDILVDVQGSPLCPHCLMTFNVSDNCASTTTSGPFPGGAMNMVNITYSIFKCHSNSYKPTIAGEFGWNEITLNGESPDPTIHPNMIESVIAGGTGIFYIHDNRIHDNLKGEGLQIGNPGETDYVWNNVWWNFLNVGSNGPQVPQSETPVAMYFWNDTVVGWSQCITDASHGYTWSGAFQSVNNLCINSAGSNSSQSSSMANPVSTPSAVINHNLGLTTSVATSDGYTAAQAFVYSPTSGGSPTVGTGTNLTSGWPGSFTTVDSHIVCSEQTVATVVQSVCTGVANTRPLSAAWDVGSYEFTGASAPIPSAAANFILLQ
jgi:hypothetical protein